MVVCDFCGTPAPASGEGASEGVRGSGLDESADASQVPLTWATSVENGKRRVYCERCSREHLRSIESKLDSEWW